MARSRLRWLIGALSAMLVVALASVGLGTIVIGSNRAIYWAATYLILGVVLVAVIAMFGLLARESGNSLDMRYQPSSTTFREHPQGEAFSGAVY